MSRERDCGFLVFTSCGIRKFRAKIRHSRLAVSEAKCEGVGVYIEKSKLASMGFVSSDLARMARVLPEKLGGPSGRERIYERASIIREIKSIVKRVYEHDAIIARKQLVSALEGFKEEEADALAFGIPLGERYGMGAAKWLRRDSVRESIRRSIESCLR